ncbi:MAG: hypothetical protein Q4B90_01050 [Eubacteriales bacterium]|nr:hypothetical protein [Eubacteriales bacterium]
MNFWDLTEIWQRKEFWSYREDGTEKQSGLDKLSEKAISFAEENEEADRWHREENRSKIMRFTPFKK